MKQQDGRLDGVFPTALESVRQRREVARKLQDIDKLLRDDFDDAAECQAASTPVTRTAARGFSFGAGRRPKPHPRYWLATGSATPGPGAYALARADGLTKPTLGGGGAVGLRSSRCCRLQPCTCKKSQVEAAKVPANEKLQDTKQARRASPPLVAYPQVSSVDPDYQTREQQKRVAAVQAEKQRWKLLGLNTTPNYRWTERRVGAGGVAAMSRGSTRDGSGNSSANTRVRKLLIAGRKSQPCGARYSRAATVTDLTTPKMASNGAVDMTKLSGREAVRCKRKGQRVVTDFGGDW